MSGPRESRNSRSPSNTPPQFNPMVRALLFQQGSWSFINLFYAEKIALSGNRRGLCRNIQPDGLLLNVTAYGKQESAELGTELGAAVHYDSAVFGCVKHIVCSEKGAESALEGIKAKGKEGHCSLVFASACLGVACLYSYERRNLGVILNSEGVNSVGAL